jgi:hypothetical protein
MESFLSDANKHATKNPRGMIVFWTYQANLGLPTLGDLLLRLN